MQGVINPFVYFLYYIRSHQMRLTTLFRIVAENVILDIVNSFYYCILNKSILIYKIKCGFNKISHKLGKNLKTPFY